MHGTCAVIKMGALKYLNCLTGMQADSNLRKLTASHFNALITQNANENMPNMFLIVYLNENLALGKQEPLIHLYVFWYTTKGEKAVKTPLNFTYL